MIKLRFDTFETVTRDLRLPVATADAITIRRAATECLKRIPLKRSLRLLGVRVSALEGAAGPRVVQPFQPDLFDTSSISELPLYPTQQSGNKV